MRIVRGAFMNTMLLDQFGARTIQKLEIKEWQSIDEVVIDFKQIQKLQTNMVRHYDNAKVPWYLDGYRLEDKDEILVAFGSDDGEGGRVFQFSREDKEAIARVIEYGVSKGIPKQQLDFMDIDF